MYRIIAHLRVTFAPMYLVSTMGVNFRLVAFLQVKCMIFLVYMICLTNIVIINRRTEQDQNGRRSLGAYVQQWTEIGRYDEE